MLALLIPIVCVWLALAAFVVILCQMAARGDAVLAAPARAEEQRRGPAHSTPALRPLGDRRAFRRRGARSRTGACGFAARG